MSVKRKTGAITATALLLAGLVLIFVARRVLGEGAVQDATSYAGLGLCLVAGALRVRAWATAQSDARGVEGRLLGAFGGCYASLLLYALSTDRVMHALKLADKTLEHVQGMLSALWPSALLVSLMAILFIELAYLRMPIPESVELRRVRTALHAGLTLALSAVFLLSINYVATARDVRKDVSYFRTTQPSDHTRAMIAKLDKPVRAVLFFPQASDVLGSVQPYFAALAKANKKLTYKVMDVALAPELASKHRVSDNGNVLLLVGEGDAQKGESFHVGKELTEARGTLKKLDATFQQAFGKLVRPERMLYLTVGHGERNAKGSELRGEDGTSVMEEVLRRLNLKTRDLGLTQGLGREVPSDASAVLVIGPSERFMPEEAETLLAYARKGGRLLLMLDPDKDVGLDPLLSGLGVALLPGTVNSETSHMAHGYNQSDRGIVFSNHYSAHPSVTTVSRHQREVASIFVNAAGLRLSPSKVEPKPRVTFPLRTDRQFWRDLNGNFDRDQNEPYEVLSLMAAVTLAAPDAKSPAKDAAKDKDAAEGRAVIIGDGDFMTNKVAPNNGNMLLFVDSLSWLVGNEELSGEASSEEDVPIEHSREQDKVWFYATTFAVPAPIVLVGAWVGRRRRRRAEGKS